MEMDLTKLYKLLEPLCSEERVLKVYQFGSRVWGTAAENADWDFFVVIKDYNGSVHPSLDLALVGCQVDISAYNVEQWKQLLEEHDMLALVCEHLPSPFVWKDSYRSNVALSLKTLVRGASKETSKCLSMSHVHFVKNGDRRTGLKNFVHATRYIEFATQMATHGALFDLGVANQRLADVMLDGRDTSKTYPDFLRLYKPQIMDKLATLIEMVQNMIAKEVSFAKSLELPQMTPTTTLEAYLQRRSLADLRRYFSITNVLYQDSIYLLESNEDSPEDNTITSACGCTLVQTNACNTTVIAQFHGYIDTHSLDRSQDIPSHLKSSENEYIAIALPSGWRKVLMWFSETWRSFSPSNPSDDNSFQRKFEENHFLYPVDTTLCITWLENIHGSEIRPLSVSDGSLRLDLMRCPLENWPSFNTETFSSVYDVFLRVSELERIPLAHQGLYLPHPLFGRLIESRSYRAYHDLLLQADFYSEQSQPHNHLKYLALALCRYRSADHEVDFPGLDTVAKNSICDELASCHQVIDNCLFFWRQVKDYADDAQAFSKTMKKLQFWRPVASIMTSIRNHTSQDPLLFLFTSPLRIYRHWADVFEPSKISRLVESVSVLSASFSSSSSGS